MVSDQPYAMNGGDGNKSYAKNSSFQRGTTEAAKEIIKEEILKNFNVGELSPACTDVIRIADFGCSTGPNTFHAVQIIVESIKIKLELAQQSGKPEYQVFFNDRTANDFNTLFASLPPERQYYAAGVPGPFQTRLFPKASLHFGYSSCTLNWLSQVPKEVVDPSSPAFNKGRILYYGEKSEVFDAYAAQWAKDFEAFLKARAQELAYGGLMALLIGYEHSPAEYGSYITFPSFELLGSCFIDMANKGRFDMEKVDSFNLPAYFPHLKELKALIEKNQDFSIEKFDQLKNPPKQLTIPDSKSFTLFIRVLFEGILQIHFGSEFIDELFEIYEEKVEETKLFSNPKENSMMVFVLLKCKRMN